MKRYAAIMALTAVFVASGPLQAAEQQNPPISTVQDAQAVIKGADLPEIWGMPDFSPQSNYMSLAGHLRNLTYQHSGTWLTREQASAAIQQEVESASR